MAIFPKHAFGLDIGDHSMKLVWVNNRGLVEAYNKITIPDGVIVRNVIRKKDLLAELVKELIVGMKGKKLQTKSVVACLPEPKTYIKLIQIPEKIKKDDVERHILSILPKHFPLKDQDVFIDWQEIRENKKEKMVEVLVGVSSRKIVDDYYDLLEKAGLSVDALHIEATAIVNALIRERGKKEEAEEEATQVIIDLGATRSSIIIYDRGVIEFTISVPASGEAITQEISNSRTLTQEDAEKRKVTCGMDQEACPDEFKIMERQFENLLFQLDNAIKFHYQHGGGAVKHILISGGVALTKKLPEYFTNKTGIPTLLGNPLVNVKIKEDKNKQSHLFAVPYTTAIGLARAAMQKK